MDTTKSTNTIYVDDEFFRTPDITKMGRILNLETAETLLNNYFKPLVDEVQQLYDNNQWIEMANKDVYYEKTCNLIIPILSEISTITRGWDSGFSNTFAGFSGRLLYYYEFNQIFYQKSNNPMLNSNYRFNCRGYECCCIYLYSTRNGCYEYHGTHNNCSCGSYSSSASYHNNSCGNSMKISVFDLKSKSLLKNLIEYDLIPKKLSSDSRTLLQVIKDLKNKGYIEVDDNNIVSILEPL